jgi:hypothetical protein
MSENPEKKGISPLKVFGAALGLGVAGAAGPEVVNQIGRTFNPPSRISDVTVSPDTEQRMEELGTITLKPREGTGDTKGTGS